jgi:hypothetical protein
VDLKDLIGAVAQVNSAWSIAAFAIAATLGVLKTVLASPGASRRGGKTAPPSMLASSLVWPTVFVICFLGVLPILANTYLESLKIRQQGDLGAVYRVRVTALDARGNPVAGATLRTTASNETTVTSQDTAVVAIPKATLPADGKVTIFADLDSAFLHGRTDLQLSADFNPSVTIDLKPSRDATVTGLVEDDNGRAIGGATVSVLGGESDESSANGSFTLRTDTAVGQIVRLHVEKPGYRAVDQEHPAGREPVTIVLASDRGPRPRRGP